jgi:hypothetical protein
MIWISQWLCPKRHCSIALAWDESDSNPQAIEAQGEEYYCSGELDCHCGICGSDLHLEHGMSRFTTMDEALGPLRAQEGEMINALTSMVQHRARRN